MEKIEELFIPYKLALEVKKLKFDEPCLASFLIFGKENPTCVFSGCGAINFELDGLPCNEEFETEYQVAAPTWDQIFSWFRIKYGIKSWIKYDDTYSEKYYSISISSPIPFISKGCITYNTYKEAQIACLEQLIKIVKEKSI